MAGGFDSKPVPIKKEPGVFIKSEFQPSLASLPMAPTSAVKQEFSVVKKESSVVKHEFAQDKKPVLGSIPGRRDRGARSSRRRGFGSSLVHRVDGYHIRAHYGNGKVDFTITKDSPKTRDLNWTEVEREMFRKLHRAHFYVEPTERPGPILRKFCLVPQFTKLRFSVQARQIQRRTQPAKPATGGYGDTQLRGHQGHVGGEESKASLDMSTSGTTGQQSNLEIPEAFLPPVLPEIASWNMEDKAGHNYTGDIVIHNH